MKPIFTVFDFIPDPAWAQPLTAKQVAEIANAKVEQLAARLEECEAALEIYKAEEFKSALFGQSLSVPMANEIFNFGKRAREYFAKYESAP